MKAQFFDGFDFDKYKFSIVAIEHVDDFFHIADFGLAPVVCDESCQRGYTAVFVLGDGNCLTLRKLFTNNGDKEAPPIDGIQPVPFHSPAGELKYDLDYRLEYTGSLVIANEFIKKYYVPFGFQLPIAFRKVYELTFDKGIFQHVEDRTKAAKALRKEYDSPLAGKSRLLNQFGKFIGKTDLGYSDEMIEQFMDLSYDVKYMF